MELCRRCWTLYELSCVSVVPFTNKSDEAKSKCEQKWVGSHPLFSGKGQTPPTACSTLLLPMLHLHTHNQCIYMDVSLLLSFCSPLALWMCMVSWQYAFHLISSSLLICFLLLFTHCHSLCFCLWLALSPALFYLLSLSHPCTPSSLPPVFYLTSPLPVVLVCALVCHEGGGGWLVVVGGLDGHLILALPHNVGMCDFFKIRFPRWVLSLVMHDNGSLHSGPIVSPSLFVPLMSGYGTSVHEYMQFFPSLAGGKI